MADDRSENAASPSHAPVASSSPASRKRIRLGELDLDPVTLDKATTWVLSYIATHRDRPAARICSPNAAIVALADKDEIFAGIVRGFELVVADGMPLLWAASVLGSPLSGQVRGVDLMLAICAAGAPSGLSVYILGGLPGAAELAARELMTQNPGLRISGTDCPPLGFENLPEIDRQVSQRIITARPDFLIVALGSPKQERWIAANYSTLPVGAIQGVGAAIDTVAGLRKRPPEWMRNNGLEWFGRLMNEPERLWRRYLFGNMQFVGAVFRQWRRRSRSTHPY
jgi:N-acetylglucosaminyldiphosphoundecaprenol N-acetyl-beta-D-mannosaminyltransferase